MKVRIKYSNYLAVVCILAFSLIMPNCQDKLPETSPPNIILIMADDMGYSDIGCYGGEISTPNLDNLAENGLRYEQFYNGARCCPTRASLLTGLIPHQAGMGWMTIRDLGHEGYSGDLNNQCLTIAEVLESSGYSSYISGKWHLTLDAHASADGPKNSWPLQRGFERFFGTILGAGSFYTPETLVRDNEPVEPGEGFFYTDAIGDAASEFIQEHLDKKEEDSPFFLYVAFTAPHWPLHARDSIIVRYMDMYTVGWDEIRSSRLATMRDMGILKPEWDLTERDPSAKPWAELDPDQKNDMVKRMAVYASQITEMDHNIGKIINVLKMNGQLDNTLIVFLADNGGCAEFISTGENKTTESIGKPESYESYRLPWANASNTPFRRYKHWTHEGGISSPLIVHWPAGLTTKGLHKNDPAQIIDIMPTFIEVAGASYPEEYEGNSIHSLDGISLVPSFHGNLLEERMIFWEHEANRAVRKGKWKLVSAASLEYPFINDWELYDMEADRTETKNLAGEHTEIVKELSEAWEEWAKTHMVYPLDGREWDARVENPVFQSPE